MNNKQVARILQHLADLLELGGENPFRVNAYRRAARALENSRQSLDSLHGDYTSLPGIGKGVAQIIKEIVETGSCQLLEERKQATPPGLIELLQLSGVGPKTIYTLYRELQITEIEELKQAAEKQQIRTLKGFGPKKEQKILESVLSFQQRPKRVLWAVAWNMANRLMESIRPIETVHLVEIAGSLRRGKETIKDIDLVIATAHPQQVTESIKQLPIVSEMLQEGERKIHFHIEDASIELPVDIRLVGTDQFASVWHHLTGSQDHNIRIRQRAKQKGLKVNEYGIEKVKTGELLTFNNEEEFFSTLDLPWIPPELREDQGEIEAADERHLPNLINLSQIQGDLHTHSLYSDGAHSIEELVQACHAQGYQYLAITDHSQSLRVANGLRLEDLYEQWKEIEQLRTKYPDFTLLKGAEVDILPNGQLDYPDEILSQMDWVVASVHTAFQQDEQTMTDRIIQAMENPYVHAIGHPTGRLILRRAPYPLHIDSIFQAAKDTGTLLELNANPYRLDLNDRLLKKAKEEYGLTFCINTDAHAIDQLEFMFYGVGTARKGWLEPSDVVNTMPWHEVKKRIKSRI